MSSTQALQPEVWTSDSNEALQIYITENGAATNFNPLFTYPIFGMNQTIFGYQDLTIFLCFDHCTFLPFLNVKYSDKLERDDIVDIKAKMMEYLPESTIFKDEELWIEKTEEEQKNFKIPGEMVANSKFTLEDDEYAVYCLNKKSVEGIELHKRLQILVLLFIEAGSYIDITDDLWDIYVLYKITDTETPSVVGFVTAYNHWVYPGAQAFDSGKVCIRKKFSQFLILPNYEGIGLGGKLYNILFENWMQNDQVFEILVEDPNDPFVDLRYRNDLLRLYPVVAKETGFELDKITTEWIDKTRKFFKIEKAQFKRLIDMLLVKFGDVKKTRLYIKQSLYNGNKEEYMKKEKAFVHNELQNSYDQLVKYYQEIINPVKFKRIEQDDDTKSVKKQKI